MLHEPMQVTRKILENHGQVTSTRERCVRQCGFIGIGSFDIVTAKKKKHHQARRPNGKKPNILTIEIAIKPVVAVSSLGFVSHSWGIANQIKSNQIKSKNQKSETQSLTIAHHRSKEQDRKQKTRRELTYLTHLEKNQHASLGPTQTKPWSLQQPQAKATEIPHST
jgi:hypothetical protein